MNHERRIAYFTMEIGLNPKIQTYSGGLGILAGDTVKSFADLFIPAVAVTLLNSDGYFQQRINQNGQQIESPATWDQTAHMTRVEEIVKVQIEDRIVNVGAWLHYVIGERGHKIPVLFLDTNIGENNDYDRSLTRQLYGGDSQYRFCQEMILGIGGMRMLNALGFHQLEKYHMNEGHAALVTIELLHRYSMDVETVKEKCVFTTHTPVAAGHDAFDIWMVGRMLKDYYPWHTKLAEHDGKFNMTYLALNLSNYVNGVAKKHKEVSLAMFPGHEIHHITNGIHTATWTSPHVGFVFSKYVPDWKHDPFSLRAALAIPDSEIWNAHYENKKELVQYINKTTKARFDPDCFTIGFARRFTAYKRAMLLFSNLDWLKAIASRAGKIQLVFAGKAHIHDFQGKEIIQAIYRLQNQLGDDVQLVYLDNYDMSLAQMLVSGVDVWLNTPMRPLEASGTSGMKAAVNGVPQFSVLDGWWIEGCIQAKTGWSIGPANSNVSDDVADAKDLYDTLEFSILPTFYRNRKEWISIMKHTIAINGSFFHTHRMVQQYVTNAYFK